MHSIRVSENRVIPLVLLLLITALTSCVPRARYRRMEQRAIEQQRRVDSLEKALQVARDTAGMTPQLRPLLDSLRSQSVAVEVHRQFEVRPSAVLAPLRFDFNSTQLRAEDARFLDTVAVALNEKPTLRLGLIGRADSRGDQEYNLALSAMRAEAARDYLMAQGVQPWRLEVVQAGEASPLDARQTESGFANNRTVQLVVAEEAVPVLVRSTPDSGATVYFFSIWDGSYRRAYTKLSDPASLGSYRVLEGPTNRRIFRSPLGWNVMMVRDGKRAFLCGVQPVRPSPTRDTTTAVVNFSDPAYTRPCDP